MSFRKTLKFFIFSIYIVFFIWIGWHGYNALKFKKYTYSLKKPTFELKGAYHLHTIYSDGIRTPEEIAKRALRAGLDFIIITDHGNLNEKSLNHQGWINGVLVLRGSEVSVREGHFVALNFEISSDEFPAIAKLAMRKVKKLNGFSIIAHPYNLKNPWIGWDTKDPLGIEIINMDSAWRSRFFLSIPYYLVFPFKPQYSLLKMIDFPEKNFKKWDEICLNRRIYGFFAVDAHLFYESLFKILNLHVLVDKPLPSNFPEAKKLIFDALSKGKFYNAIEGAAQADGFRFFGKIGEEKIQMGEQKTVKLPVDLYIRAPFPYKIEIKLIHRGRVVLRTKKKVLSFRAKKYGPYRVEIHLLESSPLSRKIPWIVSNPIFLRKMKGRRK
ncbi:PHP domain-containing protein [Candidatus Aminicenantes bacterium AC-335-A11]|nr:PHP domain-containing protein [SCandidatus Aminicenantes bacterium Aminicenantia_JdfR_composite]MCP2606553.1 PHP domain-containing protein [Candidatus Aminicenantes bacterium AC-708-I09]MCP2617920.1 PHP domain-containing protein [Candidatus Aminicenantes bacterium AC-335-A11]